MTESIVVSLGYTAKAFVIFVGSIRILARNAEMFSVQYRSMTCGNTTPRKTDTMTENVTQHRTHFISKAFPTVTIRNTYALSELWHSSYFFPHKWWSVRTVAPPEGEITLKEHCFARLNRGKDKLCQTDLQPISHFMSLILPVRCLGNWICD